MFQLSERSITLLRAAGWYPRREVGITEIKNRLEQAGWDVFPAAQEFIEEFGWLHIIYEFEFRGTVIKSEIDFDPIYTVEGIDEFFRDLYKRTVGKPLCVIGAFAQDVLLMDIDGYVYNANDISVWLMNKSGHEALENLLRGKQLAQEKLLPNPDER